MELLSKVSSIEKRYIKEHKKIINGVSLYIYKRLYKYLFDQLNDSEIEILETILKGNFVRSITTNILTEKIKPKLDLYYDMYQEFRRIGFSHKKLYPIDKVCKAYKESLKL
jgi:hypothetical protein